MGLEFGLGCEESRTSFIRAFRCFGLSLRAAGSSVPSPLCSSAAAAAPAWAALQSLARRIGSDRSLSQGQMLMRLGSPGLSDCSRTSVQVAWQICQGAKQSLAVLLRPSTDAVTSTDAVQSAEQAPLSTAATKLLKLQKADIAANFAPEWVAATHMKGSTATEA